MPLAVPTLTGKIPYDAEQAIRELVAAVNRLEPSIQQAEEDRRRSTVTLDHLQRQIVQLQQQVQQSAAAQRRAQQESGGGGLGGIGAGSAPPTVALANLSDDVVAYANANDAALQNSCVREGGSWAYLDGLVAALQAVDERVGFNGKRGDVTDPSEDAVAYYHGVLPPVEGSNDVYVVDVISCHCGPEDGEACTPGPAWNNVTTPRAAGAWLSVRP